MGKNKVIRILNILSVVIFILLIGVVTMQVIGRSPLFPQPFHWTEELTRMLFILLIAVSSIAAVFHNDYVAVDIVPSLFKGKFSLGYGALIHFIIGIFLLVLIPAAYKFTRLGARQLSASLLVNMAYIHGLILFCIVGMGIAQIVAGTQKLLALRKYKKEDVI
jgi:TRAP-type C4-dicarboxylate transport system permease small subunit